MSIFAMASVLGALAEPAEALMVNPVDWDTIKGSVGTAVAGPLPTVFLTSSSMDMGDLVGTVYFDSTTQIFTYEFLVTPGIPFITEFTSAPGLISFTGDAGYSFSEALDAGAHLSTLNPFPGPLTLDPSNAFTIELDDTDNFINWRVNSFHKLFGGSLWESAGSPITFFYQSTHDPGQNSYTLLNGTDGKTTNFFPTPEPASMALLSMGFAGLLGVVRRFRKS